MSWRTGDVDVPCSASSQPDTRIGRHQGEGSDRIGQSRDKRSRGTLGAECFSGASGVVAVMCMGTKFMHDGYQADSQYRSAASPILI